MLPVPENLNCYTENDYKKMDNDTLLEARLTTQIKPIKYDYLKYYHVVRRYYTKKYEFTHAELDMLFFLYSERFFNINRFAEYGQVVGFSHAIFKHLRQKGWVEVYRKRANKQAALYRLSYRANRIIISFYKKLEGIDYMPTSRNSESPYKNKVKNVTWSDRNHKRMIKKMNEQIKANKFDLQD